MRETFGVIVYHEQVMRTVAAVTGCDLSEADRVRRHLSDDIEVELIEPWFLSRAKENLRLSDEDAERIWHEVRSFASFGFCKAHAAAFAVPTYQSAWLKAHYPAQFLAGVLTHEPGMYPRRLMVEDAREHGIAILPLDVNRSEPDYVVEEVGEGYGIRLALQDVHGISDAEIRSILVARAERPFRDVGDLLRRTTVARPVAEALAHAGAFDALACDERNRRGHLFEAMTMEAPREGDQMTLGFPRVGDGSSDDEAPVNQTEFSFDEYTDAEVVRAELEVLGLDASRHIVSFFEPLLRDLGVTRANDLGSLRGGVKVMVAGVKVASQTPAVRSGQRIIFLSLDDGTGVTEVTVFESVQPKVARTVFHAYALAVWGELRRTGVKGVSVVAEEVWDLTALHRARSEGRLRASMDHTTELRQPSRRLWHASPGSAG
jgi:error-prone DNA polymerase